MHCKITPAKTFLTAAALVLLPAAVAAQGPPEVRPPDSVEIVTPFVFDGNLSDLPKAPSWAPGDPIKEIPRRHFRDPAPPGPPANPPGLLQDPLLALQDAAPVGGERVFTAPDLNFDGQGFTGVNPPDTVGDVGADYYIQMINASGGAVFTVYDKSDGSVAAGPTFLDTLGSGFCASGLGDPIVLYDQLAGRWVLSEFSSSGNRLCVYVSQTGDPIAGGWFNYDFQAPSFPDYPKYAVWPDAYYVSSNESSPAQYAFERAQMLVGGAAQSQRFTAPDLGAFGFQATTPADLDGSTAPPAGSPHYFIRHNDDEAHNPGSNDPANDFLEIFELSVDFVTPANSTFTGPFQVAIADIDSELCGFTSFNCFQQPGTSTRLDPLREVVMWRSVYRNSGSHETLVGNLVTDVDGTDRGGVRWYELRKTGGGPWTVFQQGTYAPDGNSRFMGSIVMDGSGNIAVGYNVSSSAKFPSLAYAGRLAADPPGTLPQGETELIAGSASNASNRYGDYSSMNLDPVDDCTIWFTGEYNAVSQWSTRIGRFAFAGCGGTCGNDVIDGNEVCDGTDLGGATCSGQGCAGGTLACNETCSGFDTSGCSGCPTCDNDGICETGEDCDGCPNDCVSGETSGAVCGNGLCEAGDGESCVSCPQDCNGKQNGRPSGRFCCGDGSGTNPVPCSDSRCTTGGFACTDVPQQPGSYCCGDLVCEGDESCSNCGIDCNQGAEMCSGGVDEDCDGAVDCDDTDCSSDPACQGCVPTHSKEKGPRCSDGLDNDCDGLIDGADPDC